MFPIPLLQSGHFSNWHTHCRSVCRNEGKVMRCLLQLLVNPCTLTPCTEWSSQLEHAQLRWTKSGLECWVIMMDCWQVMVGVLPSQDGLLACQDLQGDPSVTSSCCAGLLHNLCAQMHHTFLSSTGIPIAEFSDGGIELIMDSNLIAINAVTVGKVWICDV